MTLFITQGGPDVVGDWFEPSEFSGHMGRWWGQGVCFTQDVGTTQFSTVRGTIVQGLDDGRHIEGAAP